MSTGVRTDTDGAAVLGWADDVGTRSFGAGPGVTALLAGRV